ncbi:histone PARylation factor 1-like [Paramacrobiotus metropolitanus]|uniref:histone PARylation factor 1-like n=1 Tax=Paramacrobiotus metropolitanus TaxID=2943436 RepID=UPI002446089B|nr:histone PARylation factor 1-like [Paramacrobiotus metropolitanus]
MSSGDHVVERKRSPSVHQDEEHDSKRAKTSEDDVHTNGSAHKKNGKHHFSVASSQSDSVGNETSSQAIHGIEQEHMQEVVENVYRLRMPKDFFDFWNFSCRTNPMNPRMALSAAGIELVGPFDILAGDVDYKPSNLLELQDLANTHWRYYYDVPEFQTCLRVTGMGSQLHYGYFRDDPYDLPVFVASNDAGKDCKITEHGGNLFAAVHKLIETMRDDPSIEDRTPLAELQEVVKLHAEKFNHSLALSVETRAHRQAVVTSTWHGAGFVGNEKSSSDNTLAKRHHLSDKDLLHLFEEVCREDDIHEEVGKQRKAKAEEKLDAIGKLTEKDAQDGIYDTTLELGINIFCYGNTILHKYAKAHLERGYELFGRDFFRDITKAHIEKRTRGDELSRLPMK